MPRTHTRIKVCVCVCVSSGGTEGFWVVIERGDATEADTLFSFILHVAHIDKSMWTLTFNGEKQFIHIVLAVYQRSVCVTLPIASLPPPPPPPPPPNMASE